MKRSPFNPFFTTSCSDMIMVMMTIWMKTASVLFLTLQLIGTSVRQSIMDHLYLGYRGAPLGSLKNNNKRKKQTQQ